MGKLKEVIDIFSLKRRKADLTAQNKKLDKDIRVKQKSLKKLILIGLNERKRIYKEYREKLISEKKLATLKGVELDLINEKRLGNMFGLLKKPYNALVLYIGKDHILKPIALNETIRKTINVLKTEKYIVTDELTKKFKKIFYKGKRVFTLTPDYPINMEIILEKTKAFFFADSETFNFLINNVVDYKLTDPVKARLSFKELIKKYWWLIIIIIGIIVVFSSPELKGSLGF